MSIENNWHHYIEQFVGSSVREQFERAIARSKSENLLIEHLFGTHDKVMRSDEHYFGLSSRMNVIGRNHEDAAAVALKLLDGNPVDWTSYQFFTNPLLPVSPEHPLYRSPSLRVVCGPAYVFTYEFDEKAPAFFEQQCSWFRYRNHDTNCAIGQVYKALSEYADFLGISVCYSGNKSFHIHVAFDPNLARVAFALDDDPEVVLRAGFIQHWHILKELVLRILTPTLNGVSVEPDHQLRHPEWYRRLPGGTRLIEPKKDKPEWRHSLGVPFGTRVPQVIMWQKWRRQAAKDASALFFRPCPFRTEKAQAARSRNANAHSVRQSHDGFSEDEFAYIVEKLKDHYPPGTYPEFVDLVRQHGTWIARFRNGPADRTPSSIMRQDHSSVLGMGKGAELIGPKPLPLPLLAMMRMWKSQYHRLLTTPEEAPAILIDDVEEDEELELVLDAKHVPGSSPFEAAFVDAATDIAAAGPATRAFIRQALRENQCILLKGPEGSGKSSAITKQHDRIIRWLELRRKPVLSMYCFTDYVNAQEKCDEFNRRESDRQKRRGRKGWNKHNYRGVVLESFSQVYKRGCQALGYTEITGRMAASGGFKSVWAAVAEYQPKVLEFFREEHRRLWADIGTSTPAFFTAHAVAHLWRTGTPTRTMWARWFWNWGGDPADWRARQATELGLLIHDEVQPTDIVDIKRAEVVEWVETMIREEPHVWSMSNRERRLPERAASFDRHVARHGYPVVDGEAVKQTFEEVRSLISGGMLDWTEVTLSTAGAYPDINPGKLLYTLPVVNRHRWMVRTKYWWRDHRTPTGRMSQSQIRIADRVVILTTEELPTAVLRVADPVCWKTFSLETPHIGRDIVEVAMDRSVTAPKVGKTARKHRQRLGGDAVAVISNKAKTLIEDAQTPISARGSNQYMGQDVLQTMMFMSPIVHEQMLVLNAYTVRDDCVLLHHMDSFNQTCGRNLGYRRKGSAKHHLIVNPRLFDFLVERAAFAYSRYEVVLHLTKKQRIRIRAVA